MYNADYEDDLPEVDDTWKTRCSQCSFWIKYGLFFINFCIWIIGGLTVGIGSWVYFDNHELGIFSDLQRDAYFILISIGVIMFLVSLLACVGALRENLCILKTFCIVLALVFVLELVAGVLAFVFFDKLQSQAGVYMLDIMSKYEDKPENKDGIDAIQYAYQCCGVDSYMDWDYYAPYNCSSTTKSTCSVPPSCCLVPTSSTCGFQSRGFGEQYASSFINIDGCIIPLVSSFKSNLFVLGVIAFGVGFIELVSLVLAYLLIREIIKSRISFYYE